MQSNVTFNNQSKTHCYKRSILIGMLLAVWHDVNVSADINTFLCLFCPSWLELVGATLRYSSTTFCAALDLWINTEYHIILQSYQQICEHYFVFSVKLILCNRTFCITLPKSQVDSHYQNWALVNTIWPDSLAKFSIKFKFRSIVIQWMAVAPMVIF